jgi:hypothetical protein
MKAGLTPAMPFVASLTSVQPGVEDAGHIIETVHVADRDESLTAAGSAGAGKGVECGEGKLCLGERQPRLVAQPGVPARCCSLEAPGLLIERQQQQRLGVRERDLGELRRHRPGQQEFPMFERASELAVGAPLRDQRTDVRMSRAGWRPEAALLWGWRGPAFARYAPGRVGIWFSGRIVGLAAVTAVLFALALAPASAAPGDATMFVQSAARGQLGGGRLVLAGVSGRVSWATNAGRSGVISVRRLHRRLIRPGKPATGMLHIAGQRSGQELAFRLSRPRYNPARHTVAYRAKPLPKRRAAPAAAAGFRRRFGAASLSIIPHPTLADSTPVTCGVTITNKTGHDLGLDPANVAHLGTWDPAGSPQSTIKAGTTASWAAVGASTSVGCNNGAYYLVGATDPPASCVTAACVSISVGYTAGGSEYDGDCFTNSGLSCTLTRDGSNDGNFAWTVP